MIKFIASDLDGTLLLEGAQELPEDMYSLIRRLKKMGILFAAASGRQYQNMRRLFAPVADDMAFICENGALVVQKEKVLQENLFERPLMENIIQAAQEKEGTEFSCSTRDFYYMHPKTQEYYTMMTQGVKAEVRIISDLSEITLPCLKVAVYEPGGITEEAMNYWRGRFGDRCKVVTSGAEWIDFVPFTTNKAVGIRCLQELYGFKSEECVAFGDEYNDIEMLQGVKYGFAMTHAKPGVRAKAKYQVEREQPFLEELIRVGGDIDKIELKPFRI